MLYHWTNLRGLCYGSPPTLPTSKCLELLQLHFIYWAQYYHTAKCAWLKNLLFIASSHWYLHCLKDHKELQEFNRYYIIYQLSLQTGVGFCLLQLQGEMWSSGDRNSTNERPIGTTNVDLIIMSLYLGEACWDQGCWSLVMVKPKFHETVGHFETVGSRMTHCTARSEAWITSHMCPSESDPF